MKHIALIELNQLCDLQCEYCFYNDYGRKTNHITESMLNQIIVNGTTDIYLTGGEPFLNPDILKILKFINNKKMNCAVFCNGITLSKFKEDVFEIILDNIDRLIVSFDDFREDYFLRSIQPIYILNGIKKILNYKKTILEIKININNYNINEFKNTVERLIEIGVQKISINLTHDIISSTKKFEVDEKYKIINLLDIIDNYKFFFNSEFINHLKDFFDNNRNKLIKSCRAGNSFYFINCEGKDYICPAYLSDKPVQKSQCLSKECINLWEMY